MRETCGAVSGMLMVAGLKWGYSEVGNLDIKTAHYARVRKLIDSFKAEHTTIVCRELLSPGTATTNPEPERRTAEYYKKRPCPEQIGEAAAILEQYLKEHR